MRGVSRQPTTPGGTALHSYPIDEDDLNLSPSASEATTTAAATPSPSPSPSRPSAAALASAAPAVNDEGGTNADQVDLFATAAAGPAVAQQAEAAGGSSMSVAALQPGGATGQAHSAAAAHAQPASAGARASAAAVRSMEDEKALPTALRRAAVSEQEAAVVSRMAADSEQPQHSSTPAADAADSAMQLRWISAETSSGAAAPAPEEGSTCGSSAAPADGKPGVSGEDREMSPSLVHLQEPELRPSLKSSTRDAALRSEVAAGEPIQEQPAMAVQDQRIPASSCASHPIDVAFAEEAAAEAPRQLPATAPAAPEAASEDLEAAVARAAARNGSLLGSKRHGAAATAGQIPRASQAAPVKAAGLDAELEAAVADAAAHNEALVGAGSRADALAAAVAAAAARNAAALGQPPSLSVQGYMPASTSKGSPGAAGGPAGPIEQHSFLPRAPAAAARSPGATHASPKKLPGSGAHGYVPPAPARRTSPRPADVQSAGPADVQSAPLSLPQATAAERPSSFAAGTPQPTAAESNAAAEQPATFAGFEASHSNSGGAREHARATSAARASEAALSQPSLVPPAGTREQPVGAAAQQTAPSAGTRLVQAVPTAEEVPASAASSAAEAAAAAAAAAAGASQAEVSAGDAPPQLPDKKAAVELLTALNPSLLPQRWDCSSNLAAPLAIKIMLKILHINPKNALRARWYIASATAMHPFKLAGCLVPAGPETQSTHSSTMSKWQSQSRRSRRPSAERWICCGGLHRPSLSEQLCQGMAHWTRSTSHRPWMRRSMKFPAWCQNSAAHPLPRLRTSRFWCRRALAQRQKRRTMPRRHRPTHSMRPPRNTHLLLHRGRRLRHRIPRRLPAKDG